MHQSVIDVWHQYSRPLEGHVLSMYLDCKGYVTTGVGNLINTPTEAACLPWKLPDGSLASKDEIIRQWHMLKSQPALAKLHWKYAAKVTTIRLTDDDIDALVRNKLRGNESYMRKAFLDWDAYPADAQLGCMSMAWAVGAGFPRIFKNFTAAANAGDWLAAKVCSKIKTAGNPGVYPRNRANEVCFDNAATVLEHGMDPAVLHWPASARPSPEQSLSVKPTPAIRPVLRRGDRSDHVAALQAKLNAKLASITLVADGHFGAKTENAVRAFQTQKRLVPDGIVGRATWAALDA